MVSRVSRSSPSFTELYFSQSLWVQSLEQTEAAMAGLQHLNCACCHSMILTKFRFCVQYRGALVSLSYFSPGMNLLTFFPLFYSMQKLTMYSFYQRHAGDLKKIKHLFFILQSLPILQSAATYLLETWIRHLIPILSFLSERQKYLPNSLFLSWEEF